MLWNVGNGLSCFSRTVLCSVSIVYFPDVVVEKRGRSVSCNTSLSLFLGKCAKNWILFRRHIVRLRFCGNHPGYATSDWSWSVGTLTGRCMGRAGVHRIEPPSNLGTRMVTWSKCYTDIHNSGVTRGPHCPVEFLMVACELIIRLCKKTTAVIMLKNIVL